MKVLIIQPSPIIILRRRQQEDVVANRLKDPVARDQDGDPRHGQRKDYKLDSTHDSPFHAGDYCTARRVLSSSHFSYCIPPAGRAGEKPAPATNPIAGATHTRLRSHCPLPSEQSSPPDILSGGTGGIISSYVSEHRSHRYTYTGDISTSFESERKAGGARAAPPAKALVAHSDPEAARTINIRHVGYLLAAHGTAPALMMLTFPLRRSR